MLATSYLPIPRGDICMISVPTSGVQSIIQGVHVDTKSKGNLSSRLALEYREYTKYYGTKTRPLGFLGV